MDQTIFDAATSKRLFINTESGSTFIILPPEPGKEVLGTRTVIRNGEPGKKAFITGSKNPNDDRLTRGKIIVGERLLYLCVGDSHRTITSPIISIEEQENPQ